MTFGFYLLLEVFTLNSIDKTMCMLPFVSFILHILTHASCYSLSPSAFLLSYHNRNDVTLPVAPEEEEKLNSKSIVSTASSCLHVGSLYVCLIGGTSDHPDSPVTPPGLCFSWKEGRKALRSQEEGFAEREGGKVCCFPLLWSLSQKLQMQVFVCI